MNVLKRFVLIAAVVFVSNGICSAQGVGGGGAVGGPGPMYSGGPISLVASKLSPTEIYYQGTSEVTQNFFVEGESVVKVRNHFKLYRVHTLPPGFSGPEWLQPISGSGVTEPFIQLIETEQHDTSIFAELPGALPAGDYRVGFHCTVAENSGWIFHKLGDTIYFDL